MWPVHCLTLFQYQCTKFGGLFRRGISCVLVTCTSTIVRRTSADGRCRRASRYDRQYIPLADFYHGCLSGVRD